MTIVTEPEAAATSWAASTAILTKFLNGEPGIIENYLKMLSAGGSDYPQGHGEELYRRSLYTFWKRAVPPPTAGLTAPGPSNQSSTMLYQLLGIV